MALGGIAWRPARRKITWTTWQRTWQVAAFLTRRAPALYLNNTTLIAAPQPRSAVSAPCCSVGRKGALALHASICRPTAQATCNVQENGDFSGGADRGVGVHFAGAALASPVAHVY